MGKRNEEKEISVGLEDAEDIIHNLELVLEKLRNKYFFRFLFQSINQVLQVVCPFLMRLRFVKSLV